MILPSFHLTDGFGSTLCPCALHVRCNLFVFNYYSGKEGVSKAVLIEKKLTIC